MPKELDTTRNYNPIYMERVYGDNWPPTSISGLYRCPMCKRDDADIFHVNSCKGKPDDRA